MLSSLVLPVQNTIRGNSRCTAPGYLNAKWAMQGLANGFHTAPYLMDINVLVMVRMFSHWTNTFPVDRLLLLLWLNFVRKDDPRRLFEFHRVKEPALLARYLDKSALSQFLLCLHYSKIQTDLIFILLKYCC